MLLSIIHACTQQSQINFEIELPNVLAAIIHVVTSSVTTSTNTNILQHKAKLKYLRHARSSQFFSFNTHFHASLTVN